MRPGSGSTETSLSSGGLVAARVGVGIGLLVAVSLIVAVGLILPDDGPTALSIRQGLGIGIVFAVPAIGVLSAPRNARALIIMGGGLVVAGVATMLGGNWPLAFAILPGAVFLGVGARYGPDPSFVLIGRIALTAAALTLAVILAIPGDAPLTAGAVGLAVVATISGRR